MGSSRFTVSLPSQRRSQAVGRAAGSSSNPPGEPCSNRSRGIGSGGTVMELASITGQTVVNRKTAIYGGLAALTALVVGGQGQAQAKTQPDDSFVLLLKGLYQPVTHGPNLGLSTVDLNDGSYSTTRIYPVQGTPGSKNPHKPIGRFYTQFDGDLCAYHIPGGSFSMRFTDSKHRFC